MTDRPKLAVVPDDAFTDLYAEERTDGSFRHFHLSTIAVECFSPTGPIRKVRVRHDPAGAYWGWWNAERKRFSMIYPARMLAEMCFTYGSKAEEDRGRGRLVSLSVTKIE